MNIYQYVRKYAEYRMITAQEKALKKMREGLFDVIPAGSLDTLTAEDFRFVNLVNVFFVCLNMSGSY